MEQTWTVRGSYADWTMTITTAVPEHLDQDLEYFPSKAFARLTDQFVDTVNLYESLRDRDACTCARYRLLG